MVIVEYKDKKYNINSYSSYTEDEDSNIAVFNDYQQILGALHPEYTWYHGSGGSYQGEWWSAGVDANGNWAVQEGSFGSCSGCDTLLSTYTESDAISLLKSIDCITPVNGDIIKYLEQSQENAYSDAKEAIQDVINQIRTVKVDYGKFKLEVVIFDYSTFRDAYDAIDKTDLVQRIALSEVVLKSKISERDLKEIIGFLLRS